MIVLRENKNITIVVHLLIGLAGFYSSHGTRVYGHLASSAAPIEELDVFRGTGNITLCISGSLS